MSRTYETKNPAYRGPSIEKEILDFFSKSSIQRQQEERECRIAVEELKAENARRRLSDQRDMDEHYRNYVIPV